MRNHVTVTCMSRDNVVVLTCVGYCHVFRSLNAIGWCTSRDVFGSQFLGTISLVVNDHVGGRWSTIGWFKSRDFTCWNVIREDVCSAELVHYAQCVVIGHFRSRVIIPYIWLEDATQPLGVVRNDLMQRWSSIDIRRSVIIYFTRYHIQNAVKYAVQIYWQFLSKYCYF